MNSKNTPTLLLIAGLVLGAVTLVSFAVHYEGLYYILVTASALCILAKAGVELFRPPSEWPMVLLRTFVVMFIYAFLMPMWARIAHSVYSVPRGVNPFQLFVMGCLFANPLVTAIKVGQFLMQRLKR